MSAENIEVFQGGTFVFEVVGGRFEVYKTLVARKSRALKAMMENGMSASRAGVAPLEDTDASTFARFAEFLISGDYNPAPPAIPTVAEVSSDGEGEGNGGNLEEVQEVEPDATDFDEAAPPPISEDDVPPPACPPQVDAGWDFWQEPQVGRKKKGKKAVKSSKSYPWNPVEEELFNPVPVVSNRSASLDGPTEDVEVTPAMPTSSMFVPDGDWELDYLPVFLGHAQVYVFADTYGVRDLQRLAARRLDKALALFRFTSPCNTDFSTLLEYVYAHTAPRKNKVDTLRTIVGNFAARNMESLVGSKRFLKMIGKGGDVVRDVVVKTVSRLDG